MKNRRIARRGPEEATPWLDREPGALRNALGGMALGGITLSDMELEMSARHFFCASDAVVGMTPDNEYRVITVGASTTTERTVGVGRSEEEALRNALDHMRSLETVGEASLATIQMTHAGACVSFTAFSNYSPRISPGREVYAVPDYLERHCYPSEKHSRTYRNTTDIVGWEYELRGLIDEYCANHPDGQRLARDLQIRSFSHLTPEQAAKFSAAFVQNNSKYSLADKCKSDIAADNKTSMELLRDGIARKHDNSWEGNGVCRNVASNVKAVFEALKQTQVGLSMLNNTYCAYDYGHGGQGFADRRADVIVGAENNRSEDRDLRGHAWNKFITVDEDGSAVMTIIDATWALSSTSFAMDHLDYTELRSAAQVMQFFDESRVKSVAFGNLTNYLEVILAGGSAISNHRIRESDRRNVYGYLITEYLRVAERFMKTKEGLPEGSYLPDGIITHAGNLQPLLSRRELRTLRALDKAGGGEKRKHIRQFITHRNSEQRLLSSSADSTLGTKRLLSRMVKQPQS